MRSWMIYSDDFSLFTFIIITNHFSSNIIACFEEQTHDRDFVVQSDILKMSQTPKHSVYIHSKETKATVEKYKS